MSQALTSLKQRRRWPGLARAVYCATVVLCSSAWAQPAKLAIIIDDIGYNYSLGQRSVELPGAFTLSVLPFTPHGVQLAKLGHERGKEIMLHAPMSNEHQLPLGRGGLTLQMGEQEFLGVLRADLADIPHVVGLNNHMGSLLTQNAESMAWVMGELKARGLYFVDSRTSAKTRALEVAEREGVPSRKRDVFLDDERNPDSIRRQLHLALRKAQQQGSAIAIGHPYSATLEVLQQIRPLLAEAEVQLVPASALMPTKPAAPRSKCPAPPQYLWPRAWYPIDPFAIPEAIGSVAANSPDSTFGY